LSPLNQDVNNSAFSREFKLEVDSIIIKQDYSTTMRFFLIYRHVYCKTQKS